MASIFHDIYMVKQGGAIAIFVFFLKKEEVHFHSNSKKNYYIFHVYVY
jgi:hypothetical protein